MKIALVMSDGSEREVDLRGGLWINGGGFRWNEADDTELPEVIAEERQRGSFNVPRIFVKYRDRDGNQFFSRPGGHPIFIEALYTNISPIR